MSGLRSALGVFLYYRKFVNHFSTLAFPLNKLSKKAERWLWGEEQQGTFMRLKKELRNAKILKLSDHYKPYILTTERSQRGMGAALGQMDKELVEYLVVND